MGIVQVIVLFLFVINLVARTVDRDLDYISNLSLFMHYVITAAMMVGLSYAGFFG